VFVHAAMLMRSDVLKKIGGYAVGENYVRVEDIELWVRLYENGYKGYNLDEILYRCRDDDSAIMRRTKQNYFNEYRIRKRSFRTLNLPKIKYFYVFRPLIIAYLPQFIYKILHNWKLSKY